MVLYVPPIRWNGDSVPIFSRHFAVSALVASAAALNPTPAATSANCIHQNLYHVGFLAKQHTKIGITVRALGSMSASIGSCKINLSFSCSNDLISDASRVCIRVKPSFRGIRLGSRHDMAGMLLILNEAKPIALQCCIFVLYSPLIGRTEPVFVNQKWSARCRMPYLSPIHVRHLNILQSNKMKTDLTVCIK